MSVKNPETMACPWWDKDKHGFERSHREEHKGKSHEEYKGEKGGSNNGKMKDQNQPGKSYEQKQPENKEGNHIGKMKDPKQPGKSYESAYEKGYEEGYEDGYNSGYENGYDHKSSSSKYGDGHNGQGCNWKSKSSDKGYELGHDCCSGSGSDVYCYDDNGDDGWSDNDSDSD